MAGITADPGVAVASDRPGGGDNREWRAASANNGDGPQIQKSTRS